MSNYIYSNRSTFIHIECQIIFIKQMFEDIKVVIRSRKLKIDRQYNNQKKKDKQRSTKHIHKIKDRATRAPLKPGVNSGAPEG